MLPIVAPPTEAFAYQLFNARQVEGTARLRYIGIFNTHETYYVLSSRTTFRNPKPDS